MLYDARNNAGWLVFGMKNLRIKRGIKKTKNASIEDAEGEQYTDSFAIKDVAWLKSTIAEEKNMDTIKEKLKLSSSYRKKLLKDKSIDLLEVFPYFFTCPQLVSVRHELVRSIVIEN